jgi:hypothetical protein
VTTPPHPTRADYEAALHRIHDRRRRAGDDHPLALSDDPREILAYLRQRGTPGLVKDDTGDDVIDALTLRLWLWWEGESIELWLLEAAERTGRKRAVIGAGLGIRSSQGIVDRITRKRAMLGRGEVASRAAGIADNGSVRALTVGLLGQVDAMPAEIADDLYVDDLSEMLPRWPVGAEPGVGVVNALRFLLGQLVDAGLPPGRLAELVDAGVHLVGTRRDTEVTL